jgi:hypothetical protein
MIWKHKKKNLNKKKIQIFSKTLLKCKNKQSTFTENVKIEIFLKGLRLCFEKQLKLCFFKILFFYLKLILFLCF